jgi:hypothetical protein
VSARRLFRRSRSASTRRTTCWCCCSSSRCCCSAAVAALPPMLPCCCSAVALLCCCSALLLLCRCSVAALLLRSYSSSWNWGVLQLKICTRALLERAPSSPQARRDRQTSRNQSDGLAPATPSEPVLRYTALHTDAPCFLFSFRGSVEREMRRLTNQQLFSSSLRSARRGGAAVPRRAAPDLARAVAVPRALCRSREAALVPFASGPISAASCLLFKAGLACRCRCSRAAAAAGEGKSSA